VANPFVPACPACPELVEGSTVEGFAAIFSVAESQCQWYIIIGAADCQQVLKNR